MIHELIKIGDVGRIGTMFDSGRLDVQALAHAAPGPELAAMLARVDLTAVNGHTRVVVMAAWQRQASWTSARMYEAMALVARSPACTPDSPPELTRTFDEFAAAEVGAALGLSPRSADLELSFAYQLTERLPATHRALAAGQIDLAKAHAIADETSVLDPGLAAEAEHFILTTDTATGLTRAQLVRRLRRKVLELDPTGAEQRRTDAHHDRRIRFGAGLDGTGTITAHDLPIVGTAAARAYIKATANKIHHSGDSRTLTQIEADTFLDLLRGRRPEADNAEADNAEADQTEAVNAGADKTKADTAKADRADKAGVEWAEADTTGADESGVDNVADSGAGVDRPGNGPDNNGPDNNGPDDGGERAEGGDEHLVAKIELVAPLETWLGIGTQAAELAGVGAISPDVIADIKKAAAGGFEYCRTVTINGQVVYHQASSRRYKPTPAQRRFIQAKHRTCSQPGCSRPAVQCDLDHTVEHRLGGPSCACNLTPLCRRHHRAKHQAGWWWTHNQPDQLTAQSPLGHTYAIQPEPPPGA
jgi:hypothetical protein